MNGRIYDGRLGRFLQADPQIQEPNNSQSLNRYSYVINNPLSYTDPTGYNFLKKYWRAIVAIVATVIIGPAAQFFLGNLAGGAFTGFIAGSIATGSLKGAVAGAFSGGMFGTIGAHYGDTWNMGRVGVNSLAGGVSAEVAGGRFKDGLKLSLATSLFRMSWEYTKEITNTYKLTACRVGKSVCYYNKWGDLVTDGGRGFEQIDNTDPGKGNWLTASGMSEEGAGFDPTIPDHAYSENSNFGRFINLTSKPHDYYNSNLSRYFGFEGYDVDTGMWLQGNETYNSLFQVYSFGAMLPAAIHTSVAMMQPYSYLLIQEKAQ